MFLSTLVSGHSRNGVIVLTLGKDSPYLMYRNRVRSSCRVEENSKFEGKTAASNLLTV
jgi:hypothetical protein